MGLEHAAQAAGSELAPRFVLGDVGKSETVAGAGDQEHLVPPSSLSVRDGCRRLPGCYASRPVVNQRLNELQVLALDCQAAGASPTYGDLLELGWGVCGASGLVGPVESHWIVPRTRRRIGRPVRELTGWSEACLDEAVTESDVWTALGETSAHLRAEGASVVPSVIHFARFELVFLRDLHERLGAGTEFPFDVVCLHAIAARLFPDLPRRNIRALAGYLGHSPELVRRSAGHVEATAFIWRELVPLLEKAGISTW